MKSIVISIFLLFSLQANSQHAYFPMDSVNSWNYEVGSFIGSSEFWLEAFGDTIIAGKNYRVIADPNLGILFGKFMREDTSARKVYVFEPNSNQEVLYYDFSLEVGDYLESTRFQNPIICSNKEVIEVQGRELYQWTFGGPSEFKFSYIEGLGGDHLFNSPYLSDPIFFLRCAFYNCLKIYGDGACSHSETYLLESEIEIELCPGESYMSVSDPGIYQFINESVSNNTCDSLITLTISIINGVEIPYNGIDDDCNPLSLDDDLDEDGFALAYDCNDQNENINPDATEIANNGVDEDCDGYDLLSATHEYDELKLNIYPNPGSSIINIDTKENLNFRVKLYNTNGRLVIEKNNTKAIDIEKLSSGVYFIEVSENKKKSRKIEKIVII